MEFLDLIFAGSLFSEIHGVNLPFQQENFRDPSIMLYFQLILANSVLATQGFSADTQGADVQVLMLVWLEIPLRQNAQMLRAAHVIPWRGVNGRR